MHVSLDIFICVESISLQFQFSWELIIPAVVHIHEESAEISRKLKIFYTFTDIQLEILSAD
jgi:hypothetical protein